VYGFVDEDDADGGDGAGAGAGAGAGSGAGDGAAGINSSGDATAGGGNIHRGKSNRWSGKYGFSDAFDEEEENDEDESTRGAIAEEDADVGNVRKSDAR
jgi:hypothetical protein